MPTVITTERLRPDVSRARQKSALSECQKVSPTDENPILTAIEKLSLRNEFAGISFTRDRLPPVTKFWAVDPAVGQISYDILCELEPLATNAVTMILRVIPVPDPNLQVIDDVESQEDFPAEL